MPANLRHGNRKYVRPGNGAGGKARRRADKGTRQPAVLRDSRQISPPGKAADNRDMAASRETPGTLQGVYVIAELKRIGILTGIIIVILIVLAMVLR